MATTSPCRFSSCGIASGTVRKPVGGGPNGFGAFLYVTMCATPGIFSATAVSMLRILACGCGQVRKRTYNKSANHTRLAYIALPVNLGMETSGIAGIALPTTFRFSGG